MKSLTLIEMILAFLVVVIVSYLIGCINFAIIISKAKSKGKGDIRSIGSGNPGMLNMSRAYGIGVGILILFLDICKGLVPCLVCRLVFKNFNYLNMNLEVTALYLAGLGAVCGHIFPFWLKFKGGKGISTTIGVFLASQPLPTLLFGISAIVFILLTRMGSMGSFIATTPSAIVSCWFFYRENHIYFAQCLSLKILFLLTSLCVLIIILITWWAHRKNIQRLLVGEEHPTNWLQMIKNLSFKSKVKKHKQKNSASLSE